MYRVKAWLGTVYAAIVTTESFPSKHKAERIFAELLDMEDDEGKPTFVAGHIEHHIRGIGWVPDIDTANYPDPD